MLGTGVIRLIGAPVLVRAGVLIGSYRFVYAPIGAARGAATTAVRRGESAGLSR